MTGQAGVLDRAVAQFEEHAKAIEAWRDNLRQIEEGIKPTATADLASGVRPTDPRLARQAVGEMKK